MSEVVSQESGAEAEAKKDPRLDPGYFIVQIETHDPRLAALFTNKSAKVPTFGIHDVTPAREFNALNDLKRSASNMVAEFKEDGTLQVTLAVDEFTADDALTFSSMTHGSTDPKRPLLDKFMYRGSNQDFQRVSEHNGRRSAVEHVGVDVPFPIDLDHDPS